MKNIVHLIDNMEFMRGLPDNAYDLAIVDPPYGIGEDGAKNHSRGKLAESTKYLDKDWDNKPPEHSYFIEAVRVSKHQIIWGANHFIENIPKANTPSWVVWDKQNGASDFADCELAWTSHCSAVRRFSFRWSGMLQGNMKNKESRIHPTQKPVALYKWLLQNYAKPGQTIFDSHVGSGSIRIACHDLGFDFEGCEIDEDYWQAQEDRFNEHVRYATMQPPLFEPEEVRQPEQVDLPLPL